MALPRERELEKDRELALIQVQASAVDIVIAGAGLGGLLTAIGIRKRSARTVHIFDCHPQPLYVKATPKLVSIWPNGFQALQSIDQKLAELVKEAGTTVTSRRVVRSPQEGGEGGEEEVAITTPPDTERRYGHPTIVIDWGVLYRILLLHLPPDVVRHHDRAVSGFEEDDSGVEVRFHNKTNVVRAKLLIGADGMFSSVRRQVVVSQGGKDDKATYSGHVKWESVIPSSVTRWELLPEGAITQIWSKSSSPGFCGRLVNLGNSKICWQVAVEDPEQRLVVSPQGRGGLGLYGVKAVVLEAVKGQKDLKEAVMSTREEEIYERCVYYHPPLHRIGQGANLSMEGACQLSRLLALHEVDDPEGDGVPEALKEYEHVQLPRANRIQMFANEQGGRGMEEQYQRTMSNEYLLMMDFVLGCVVENEGDTSSLVETQPEAATGLNLL